MLDFKVVERRERERERKGGERERGMNRIDNEMVCFWDLIEKAYGA